MTTETFRKGQLADLPAIMEVYKSAKAHLKAQGINQWQSSYPSDADLRDDIEKGFSYVLDIDGDIAAVGSIITPHDPDYLRIEDGSWLTDTHAEHAAFHRTAVSDKFRGQGLSKKLMQGLITTAKELGFNDMRIDTHEDNKAMQHVITSNGFDYRGIIWTKEDNDKARRFAYQLVANQD
ncbi:GNAT family N-acetyltransferase [Weissella halotolerans]|uniref:N-acetyltransferase GCN5 n=1 Tax=Weissella halotolerans DSM 20190 TaxID=1123500 RepID=A0A0R2G5Q5_9LACO|nr:GNAT family N-acetyltransferase [Weissella halotolerans]KRN33493.1 N-acetyltransferase GCN5 [Weissella halotolerans DSM 20190]